MSKKSNKDKLFYKIFAPVVAAFCLYSTVLTIVHIVAVPPLLVWSLVNYVNAPADD